MSLRATIMVPTTGDRGPLLPYSVGSILKQTVPDIEVFLVGDGVTEETRQVIRDLMSQDSRVRFFDHPKAVRRGELNRHAALAEARGDIVCYLCDRDLMLPDHVATMTTLLASADLAHTFPCLIGADDRLACPAELDIGHPSDRKCYSSSSTREVPLCIPLSCAGHTLAMYRRLPHGWRTTPIDHYTDGYMWQQFLDHPECRAVSSYRPTVLWFSRYPANEWSSARRLAELVRWQAKMAQPGSYEEFLREVLAVVARTGIEQSRALRPYRKVLDRLRTLPGFGRLVRAALTRLRR